MKFCKSCSTDKSPEQFPKNKRLPDGLGYECKECAHARFRKWFEDNPSHNKERGKRAYLSKRDDYLERKRIARLENPELFKERDRQTLRRNRAANRAKCGRRRASRNQATPPWLTKDHVEMMKITYAMAAEMGRTFGRRFHVDHIHPLQGENVCGLHVPWNLQVLPMEENIAKHNRFGA